MHAAGIIGASSVVLPYRLVLGALGRRSFHGCLPTVVNSSIGESRELLVWPDCCSSAMKCLDVVFSRGDR